MPFLALTFSTYYKPEISTDLEEIRYCKLGWNANCIFGFMVCNISKTEWVGTHPAPSYSQSALNDRNLENIFSCHLRAAPYQILWDLYLNPRLASDRKKMRYPIQALFSICLYESLVNSINTLCDVG